MIPDCREETNSQQSFELMYILEHLPFQSLITFIASIIVAISILTLQLMSIGRNPAHSILVLESTIIKPPPALLLIVPCCCRENSHCSILRAILRIIGQHFATVCINHELFSMFNSTLCNLVVVRNFMIENNITSDFPNIPNNGCNQRG